MTGIAIISREDMIAWFANGGDTVMAATASANGEVVIKSGRRPGQGAMATIAFDRRGGDMARMFTRGGNAVVTTTTPAHHRAVIQRYGVPTEFGMTIITNIIGRNMLGGFAGRNLRVMTGFATLRRALKYASEMTSGTVNITVATGQRKTGLKMIKLFFCHHCTNIQ